MTIRSHEGVLHLDPDAIARSNYHAVIDQDECNGCEVCVERCQVDAIQMEDDVAVASRQACIGCGLCVSTCPTDCISLTHKTGDQASPVFADSAELLRTLAREKDEEYRFQWDFQVGRPLRDSTPSRRLE
jgi:Na+-translocating ferredoxin:NAD+ oxidoreductase RNF subunit RnfB